MLDWSLMRPTLGGVKLLFRIQIAAQFIFIFQKIFKYYKIDVLYSERDQIRFVTVITKPCKHFTHIVGQTVQDDA